MSDKASSKGEGRPKLEWWTPTKLKAHPLNWRRHPDRQRAALGAVMEKVGWAGAVVFNERTGFIIDGHLRYELALEQPRVKVPVFVVDLPADKEAAALATFDTLGEWAGGDLERFEELRVEVAGDFEGVCDEVGAMFAGVASELADERAKAERIEQQDTAGYWVKVECDGVAEQQRVYDRLMADGHECRVLTL